MCFPYSFPEPPLSLMTCTALDMRFPVLLPQLPQFWDAQLAASALSSVAPCGGALASAAWLTLSLSCPAAYGLGLLVTFVALVLMQRGQPALLYLVPCTLLTSCTVALWRQELGAFWTGSGFAVNTSLL